MANIDRIVNIQIALNTAGISKKGFGSMLVAGYHLNSLNRVDIIQSVDDLLNMGFEVTDPIYKAVSAALSQNPRAEQVKLGRLSVKGAQVAITADNNTKYVIEALHSDPSTHEVVTEKFEYDHTEGDASAIATALAEKITGDFVSADAAGDKIQLTITGDVQLRLSDNMTLTCTPSSEDIADEMAKIRAEDADFYGVILASRDKDKIMAMAEYVETQTMLFGTGKAEAGAALASVSNDLASMLAQKQYSRTFVFPTMDDSEYKEAAEMSRCFAIAPGGETWALKTLNGVSTDGWTETEAQAIFKKNANTYEKVRNVAVTQNGKVASGEWIDVIRFRDWLQEELATDIFTLLKNEDKIPYGDAGIAMVENTVRRVLERGQSHGGISPTEYDADGKLNPGFVISVPLAADISANDKASRILRDVKFTARLAGAIHAVKVTGSFTYQNLA